MHAPAAPVRIARPTRDLAAARRFWCDGLGLDVPFETGPDADGGHALLMVGWPGAAWHLELVADAGAVRTPGVEDLLVVYLGRPVEPADLEPLLACGGRRVVSANPYWERWGVTVEDPDGCRLVLSSRTWP